MKNSTPELRALLDTGVFQSVDLYTLTLVDGTVIRTTNADIDLTWGSDIFVSDQPIITREKITTVLGLEVDALNITVIPGASDTLSGLAYGAAVRAGVLDGATFLMQKAYVATWPTIVGVLHGFEGTVSDIDGAKNAYNVQIKAAIDLLNIDMPRNVYQGPCLHQLYGPGCTVDREAFTETGTTSAGSTQTVIQINTMAFPAGYFDQGVIAFTSGPNSGQRRTIKSYTPTSVTISLPLPALPLLGNAFSIYPGCDKSQATCLAKFDNLEHFKGYPYIPSPETAL